MWRRDEPGWWYGPEAALVPRLLMPASLLWGHIAERRWAKAVPFHARVPVICIGNFTTGGTGKTPLALHMAGVVERLGRSPVFLTRGYGGRLTGPHHVVLDQDIAADVGDEPLLLVRRAPVMLARDRAAGARAILAAGGRRLVIIMDDGLQNPALAKDVTIAVVDGRRGIGNGRVIPAGPLRAPVAAQLARVDAIVINQPAGPEAGPTAQAIADQFKTRFSGPVLRARTGAAGDTAWLKQKPVLAFAAIGAPQRFFGLLQSLGGEIVREVAFPDHHPFSEMEAAGLLAEAKARGTQLVTTEKDWVRLSQEKPAQAQLRAASRPLAIAMRFAEPDAKRLETLIEAALARHDAAATS